MAQGKAVKKVKSKLDEYEKVLSLREKNKLLKEVIDTTNDENTRKALMEILLR